MFSVFLKIIRWKELLYFIFLLFLFKFCFINGYGFKTTLSFFYLSILALTTILIIASGYLTSYFYRKKGKKTSFPLQKAKILAITFAFLSFFLGAILSFKIQKPNYSFIFLFCLIITTVYAVNVKKKTFIDSLIKSFLKPFIILIVLWFDAPLDLTYSQWNLFFKLQAIAIAYVSISFLSNIAREIVIDINNINHDNVKKNNTLPVLLGRKRAKNTALTIAILICFFVLYFTVNYIENKYLLTIIISLLTIPELVFIYFLMKANSSKNYIFVYKISNVAYILGVLSIPILTYFLKHVI